MKRARPGGEALGQRLQRHRLAGAGGAGDQPVAVGHGRQQRAFDVAMATEKYGIGHAVPLE
jgi:hypothetical protein